MADTFMTFPRFSTARLLVALCMVCSLPAARAADAPQSGNFFSAPGYPPAPAPPSATAPGSAGPAVPAGQGDANATRSIRNATDANVRPSGQLKEQLDTFPYRAESPAAPSEFQKFVEAATGRLLPVFGSRFFADAANASSPVDNVPVSADYTVGPGDEIMLRAWGSIDVDYRSTVDRNGMLNLPKIGSFSVAGVKAADLEKNLRAQIGRLYTNFNLSVSLGQLRGVRVFVVGPAQRPGVYTLASQSTLLSAVVMAGGPAPSGSMRKVLLRRNGQVISELDLYEFLVQGDKSKDVQLAAGDVIVFQPVGARVALTGALDTPAIYELKALQEPVREVLRYSGGKPLLANPNMAQLERIDASQPKAARFVEEFRLDGDGLQKPLRDGDVLTLLQISPQFANAVTLRGRVALPLRYPYTPGMRIRDLIPNRDALISPDFYQRKNLLVQAIKDDGNLDVSTKTPTPLFDDLNWDYAVIERLNPKDLSTEVIPFNLGKAVLQGDEANNLALMPGDVVTIYSQKDIRVPVSRQTRLVSLEGEIMSPGVYQLLPGDTLKTLVARAGGFTPQAYLYGLEFSREETRQRQRENLKRALARLETLASVQAARDAANMRSDPTGAAAAGAASAAATNAQLARLRTLQPNGRIALELDPDTATLAALPDVPMEVGDRVIVPPRPGFVTVAGAVANDNAYLWKPGRTAGEYLKLAGADEAADPANAFILRADGTVTRAGDKHGFFSSDTIDSQPMYPGDALIVPNQLDFETWGRAVMRNLKDFAQIFSGFGIGVASLKAVGL